MCQKVLILCNPDHNSMEFHLDIPIDCIYAYCDDSISTKLIRNNKFLIKYVLTQKLIDIDQYTHIIIFDMMYKPGLVREIRRLNSYARIIFYFRNTIYSLKRVHWRFSFEEMNQNNVEIWSYSQKDCETYGFRYNAQFVNNHLMEKANNQFNKYDLVFVGKNKHRSQILKEIYNECEKKNIKNYFYVMDRNVEKYNQNNNNKYLPYDLYIRDFASQSKALLDIVTDENYGLTLRPLEALHLNKKLVTNFYDIRYEDFYDPSNIFLLDNNLEKISEFLSTSGKTVSEETKRIYTCEHWIERFLQLQM